LNGKLYYHFTKETLRDGTAIPPIGEWLAFDGPIVMCSSGLHASETPYDALQYAPGPLLHQVELYGIADIQADKVVAKRRKIVATIDATGLLRDFARKQALSVIHLWDCPAITKQYLETGDDSIRSAAEGAARSAAGSAARSAAWSIAWGAARSAAWSAAESAAWSAAWSAAEDAAEGAARSAAWSAAEDAARSAARSAAWSAARSAAREMFDATVTAAFAAQKLGQSAGARIQRPRLGEQQAELVHA
jgi:hypothetical protein